MMAVGWHRFISIVLFNYALWRCVQAFLIDVYSSRIILRFSSYTRPNTGQIHVKFNSKGATPSVAINCSSEITS